MVSEIEGGGPGNDGPRDDGPRADGPRGDGPRDDGPRPVAVDLDEQGRLLDPATGLPVRGDRLAAHLADRLRMPAAAGDVYVHVPGWQTTTRPADRAATDLTDTARALLAARPALYPGITAGYRPWCVVVRWPSASPPTLAGYRRIRDRAAAMSAAAGGSAGEVLARLLGCLDAQRGRPAGEPGGDRYLHLLGHSFGGRFLCEAVRRAAADRQPPFTVDSMLLLQPAAPREAYATCFPALFPAPGRSTAPLRGPLVLAHARGDAPPEPGALRGPLGGAAAAVRRSAVPLLPVDVPYHRRALESGIVNVLGGAAHRAAPPARSLPACGHGDLHHPELAHLLLSLAALAR
ncbi:hypothetical protein [Kitasatospora sp. LaBMicrA B282]|uniref:hypothetical protein n=1 Tax=Kitasatospora sp. LaBMicrA B282 TaxID=3420949 RepID=UPI003D12E0A0